MRVWGSGRTRHTQTKAQAQTDTAQGAKVSGLYLLGFSALLCKRACLCLHLLDGQRHVALLFLSRLELGSQLVSLRCLLVQILQGERSQRKKTKQGLVSLVLVFGNAHPPHHHKTSQWLADLVDCSEFVLQSFLLILEVGHLFLERCDLCCSSHKHSQQRHTWRGVSTRTQTQAQARTHA